MFWCTEMALVTSCVIPTTVSGATSGAGGGGGTIVLQGLGNSYCSTMYRQHSQINRGSVGVRLRSLSISRSLADTYLK